MSEIEPSNFFKIGKTLLTGWGLWPRPDLGPIAGTLYKIYGFGILSTTIIPYNICSMIDLILQLQSGEWMEMLPRLSVSLAMMLGFFKVMVYLYHMPKIQECMDAFEKQALVYKTSKYLEPFKIVKRCIWLYNVQVSVCFGIFGILVMTNIDAIFRDPIILEPNVSIPILPFINWLPYDYTKTPYYEISFCMIDVWFFTSANIIIVFDSICMGLMIHTSGQLKILRLALETLHPRAKEEVKISKKGEPNDWEIDMKISEMFRKCATHHQAIISNTDKIENIFSTVIFLQFSTSCLMVCFTILIVTNDESLMSSRISCLIILGCSMWELTVYCYFGNQIILESNDLSCSAYTGHWYVMDKSMKANLSIMISRSQKPIIFKAGGFVPLSLHTFLVVKFFIYYMHILKASYSYYAFLRTITE